MDWTKIPTSLITRRYSDHELLSIIKYQLIWSLNEESPDQETCLRYMTEKQFKTALEYCDSISARVSSDVSLVIRKRNANKIRYSKNKEIGKIQHADSLQTADTQLEQIREDIDIDLNKTINIQDSLSASAENSLSLKTTESDNPNFPTYAEKKTRQGKRLLPDDWYPKEKTITALKERGVVVDKAIDKFINSCKANGYKYVDFDRALLSWNWEKNGLVEQQPKYQPKLDDEIRAKL